MQFRGGHGRGSGEHGGHGPGGGPARRTDLTEHPEPAAPATPTAPATPAAPTAPTPPAAPNTSTAPAAPTDSTAPAFRTSRPGQPDRTDAAGRPRRGTGGAHRQPRRGPRPRVAGATALAAAVIGGLLGGAPAAAAPPAPGGDGGDTASAPEDRDRKGGSAVPAVWPRPQDLRAQGGPVPVGERAVVVADGDTDPYALDALREVLRNAGADTVLDVSPGAALPPDALVVRADARGAEQALRALRASERGDLPSGGYRLAVGRTGGRDTVALAGEGPDGLFHAVQTLRQLVTGDDSGGGSGGSGASRGPGNRADPAGPPERPGDGRDDRTRPGGRALAGVVVRDWPAAPVRGTTEGFYGTPWSHGERLAQLGFLGRTKQNHYLYAPGDDPYRQARWRDPYPAGQRAEFRALADRARRNHVTLGWAVAPGQALCFSSDEDLRALNRKIDAMWALGVRSFQLQFQDVSYSEWHCEADRETYGSGPGAAARAQARVANAAARHLAGRHPGAEPLTLMPTEFYQDGSTDYRDALAGALHSGVHVAWTGVGVVPGTITGGELAEARSAFGHPLVTMDNYPVNDYAKDRLFLGPYTGREPAVATGSSALLTNAMQQPAASRIPLFTAADYAWNPRGYRPAESWRAAVDDLAGEDAGSRAALRALAANDASSVLGGEESAYLRPLIEALWEAYGGTDREALERAAQRLDDAFAVMRKAPERLSGPDAAALREETGPWLDQLARYGRAGRRAVAMLLAQDAGDGAAAWRAQLDVRRLREEIRSGSATVGKGVLAPFLDRALDRADAWTGADRAGPATSVTQGPSELTVDLGRPRPLAAVTVLTAPGKGSPADVEAHVPGEGWRPLGALSEDGWTQLRADGVRADTLRLTWPEDGRAPEVHRVVPWFGDTPGARLELEREETDAVIGGRARTVPVELVPERPGDIRGRLVARAPEGVEVEVPDGVTVRRGATTEVPVRVTVPENTPAGSYEVPFDFAGEERTLTVRAYPETGGPDLARGAKASSSGDETAGFPAAAAVAAA
ncbi:beta-N-acetylglucosaminidase domain-containing protein, partial [Streptomyces sp. NPDC048845]|uniref:beta-N-acetylhexosaminidase family protein n=1 Tax=Streptomyces sp. NPDC048845 TaxID=3155390 RepID=UPI00341F3BA4